MAKLNIVLLEPEIPANTGNIGRTCVATDTKLHLIEPLGFSLSEKALKRAGMDYWKDLDVTTYLDYEDFLEKNPNAKKFDTLNYMDVLNKGLQVMDSTAISMCMDNDIDLIVFNMNERGNILKAIQQTVNGTVITKKK